MIGATHTKQILSFSTAALVLSAALLPGAAQEARAERKVEHEVLAFYYTWYGTPERHGSWVHWNRVEPGKHFISDATHYPAQGAYDSHDPELIDWQIDLAKGHGLTGFIATWWGQGTYEDQAFPIVLERAGKKNFVATVYWEVAPGKDRAQIEHAVSDLVYLLTRYATNQAFLKVEGKPVIFVYGRVMGQVPAASWPEIVSQARAKAGDFLLMADGYQESYARQFDGLHEYNPAGAVKGKGLEDLRTWAARYYAKGVTLARKQNGISCVTVIPGYDDTKIRKPGLAVDRKEGQVYRALWEEAIKAKPDWVLITSWNEWHEGSEIEPSLEFGEQYLSLTGEFAKQFWGR